MGVIFIVTLLGLRESHSPTLLKIKARKLRKQYPDTDLVIVNQSKRTPSQAFFLAITRPTKLLVFSPIVLGLSIITAVTYGYIYILFTTMTSVFMERYGMASNTVGLTYLAYGIGNIVGNVAIGLFSDKFMRAMADDGEMKPEYRLPPLLPGSLLVPAGLLLYGWTLEYNVHWIVPLIGMFLLGLGAIFVFIPVSTYLVDAFTDYAASASAANTVLRSIGGALLPLCGGQMYQTVGDGWGNTILAFISIAFIPVVWWVHTFGERLRTGKAGKAIESKLA